MSFFLLCGIFSFASTEWWGARFSSQWQHQTEKTKDLSQWFRRHEWMISEADINILKAFQMHLISILQTWSNHQLLVLNSSQNLVLYSLFVQIVLPQTVSGLFTVMLLWCMFLFWDLLCSFISRTWTVNSLGCFSPLVDAFIISLLSLSVSLMQNQTAWGRLIESVYCQTSFIFLSIYLGISLSLLIV